MANDRSAPVNSMKELISPTEGSAMMVQCGLAYSFKVLQGERHQASDGGGGERTDGNGRDTL